MRSTPPFFFFWFLYTRVMNLAKYKKIENIPNRPGVYFWKNGKTILYIGKATNLKNRTASYLGTKLMQARGPLIVKMIEEADILEWRETSSVLEALLLETHLIKKHQPIYNSKEKDNKSHNYVVITNEDLPRIYPVRGRILHQLEQKRLIKKSFGPFPQGKLLIEALKIIRKIFPFLGKAKKNESRNEFYRQLGQLPNTTNSIDKEKYLQNIQYIIELFSGNRASILRSMKKDMKTLSDKLDFESAARIRNQIYALNHIKDIALMKHDFETAYYQHMFRIEAYDIGHLQGAAMVGSMVVHNGASFDSDEYRLFNINNITSANDPAALAQVFNRRLDHPEWPLPQIVVVDGGMVQKRVMEKVLRNRELKIPVVAVVKDDRHRAKGVLGRKDLIEKHQKIILSINAESHRFTIQGHKRKLRKNFLS